jgi:hypothetical protein
VVVAVSVDGSESRSHCALPEAQIVQLESIRNDTRRPATWAVPSPEAYWMNWYQGPRPQRPIRCWSEGLMVHRSGARGNDEPGSKALDEARAVKNAAVAGF